MAEAAGIPIVLTVPAGLITGIPISGEAYARALGDSLITACADETQCQRPIRGAFERLADEMRSQRRAAAVRMTAIARTLPPSLDQTAEQREIVESLQRRFIHLRDATATLGNSAPVKLGLWRGRISEVAGWSLGRFEVRS